MAKPRRNYVDGYRSLVINGDSLTPEQSERITQMSADLENTVRQTLTQHRGGLTQNTQSYLDANLDYLIQPFAYYLGLVFREPHASTQNVLKSEFDKTRQVVRRESREANLEAQDIVCVRELYSLVCNQLQRGILGMEREPASRCLH